MKLAVLGQGKIVRELLPHLTRLPEIRITAVWGRRASAERLRALCGRCGIPYPVFDWDGVAQSGADTVYVALPNHLHYSACKEALERGYSVIVEKPMTTSLTEALALRALAEDRGLCLFEAISTLHLPGFHQCERWLPEVGEVQQVETWFCQFSSRYDAFLHGETAPVFDPNQAGGALMDLNLYNIHFVMGLFGEPESAVYQPRLLRSIDVSGTLTLQYPTFRAVCHAAKDRAGELGGLIIGSRGVISVSTALSILDDVTLNAQVWRSDGEYRLLQEFRDFDRILREGDKAECHRLLDRSLAVCRVMTGARLAAGLRFPADEWDSPQILPW